MKKAVEWLVDEIKIQQQMYIDLAKKNKSLKKEVDAILTASTLIIMKSEQAKEMEKEQMKNGCDEIFERAKEIDNETFKQQEQ